VTLANNREFDLYGERLRKLLRELGLFRFPYSLRRKIDTNSNALALVALAFTIGLPGTNFPLSPVVKKNVNWVISSFRLGRFVTAGVTTNFQGTDEGLAVVVSRREFTGSKGTIGSSYIVTHGVVVLLSHPFDESCQSLELAKVIIELFGELLQD